MPSSTVIQEYIVAAQTGETTAWNILYAQYYPSLYALALRICGNTSAAKDAVQESFVMAYLKLSQLKDVTAFSGWIRKILMRNCYEERRVNPLREVLDKIPSTIDSWWEDEMNRKLDRLSAQGRLYTSLAQLPEVLRSTLLLRYFSGFQSYTDIAAILGVPVGTVRSRLNQAKLKLAEHWRSYNYTGTKIFEECEEWNQFYFDMYSAMHYHDDSKNRFINHLQKDIRIFVTGDMHIGRQLFENLVADDRKAGSWCAPVNVSTSGNISVVEVRHFNSKENPDHCPFSSVAVLYRNKEKVNKINLHLSSE